VKRRYLDRARFWRGLLPERQIRITHTLAELDQAVADFRAAAVPVLATLGGDGTLHHLADSLVRQYGDASIPIVLPLAGGTMNGVSRALGGGGSAEAALRQALAALNSGASPPLKTRQLLRVEDVTEGRTRYGFGFGAGLVVRAFQEYYRTPEPGLGAAISAALLPLRAALFGGRFYQRIQLELVVDGVSWLADPHTVVASVTDDPLLWFRPFGRSLAGSDVFHFAATSMSPGQVAFRLWSIFRGRCRHPRLRIGQVRNAILRGESGYLIDGDLYLASRVLNLRLTAGPRLRFLVSRSR
jgi:hypothetical protein